jgi:zinc ribbon protein
MFCPTCGSTVEPNTRFCPSCGREVGSAAPTLPNTLSATWIPPQIVEVRAGHWVGEGWRLVKSDIASYVLMTLVFLLLGSAACGLIQGSLIAGMHLFTIKKILGRNATFGDMFQGFNFFVPTLLASLVIALFVGVATLFFIIPGLVVAAMYKFTYLFIVDKRMDFWQAMRASHEVVRRDYVGFTLFLVLLILVDILGVAGCVVGALVAIPVTFAAITVAYRETVGFDQRTIDAL